MASIEQNAIDIAQNKNRLDGIDNAKENAAQLQAVTDPDHILVVKAGTVTKVAGVVAVIEEVGNDYILKLPDGTEIQRFGKPI